MVSKKVFRRGDVRQRIFRFVSLSVFFAILVMLYFSFVRFLMDVEDGKDDVQRVSVVIPLANCSDPRRSFQPLGEFKFWGKVMNASWPCPTSGMNNQLMMMMGKLFCLSEAEAKRGAAVSSNGNSHDNNNNNNNNNNSNSGGKEVGIVNKHSPSVAVFKWKDITCSPTGGKEGKRRYAVGGDDYVYMWFRWSELMEFSEVRLHATATSVNAVGYAGVVSLLPTANETTQKEEKEKKGEQEQQQLLKTSHDATHVTHICLSDVYGWSEQPWLSSCPASVDAIWGTAVYWDMRYALKLHTWFEKTAVDFLQRHGVARSPSQSHLHAVLGLHIRRGDYEKFCRENAHGKGRRKYRVPPFVYLKRWKHPNNTILGANFWDACYPSLQQIITTVATITAKYTHIRTVMLMTNSVFFRKALTDALRERKDTQHLNVLSFVAAAPDRNRATTTNTNTNTTTTSEGGDNRSNVDIHSSNNNNTITTTTTTTTTAVAGEVPPSYWGRSGAAYYTTAEAAWMDIALISLAEVMVLNRYSTFSHSVVDVHILREKRLASKLYWW
ncbi:uncharacterized protein TM35_000061280 [Trypanosoma theileri]|uniref:Uncharacterized protein n=1 Tax=Trypanosoma theileri TaxID=67003 RepID=A0A1X0P350_9TRYP|nr:uncharacterized protein TM35_000061280 [Trypanosoma theileri]ORC91123.1 hypothetical protein TM35_000061280 [Trypanosoma theileri]